MNRKLFSTIALSLAALSVGSAFAAQPAASLTRQQVLAELAEAQRTGDIVEVHGSTIKKLNELHPASYPAKAEQPGLSRAQVLAELAEAQRTGELVVVRGATMKKLNEFDPAKYPAKVATVGKTRQQVQAELIEAQRTGEIVAVRGATMKKLNEFDPAKYPAPGSDSAQVYAESAKAKQTESM